MAHDHRDPKNAQACLHWPETGYRFAHRWQLSARRRLYADRFSGWVKGTLVMYGRVPFAFYIAHFYLAHVLAVAIGVWQGYTVSQMSTPPRFYPKGFGLSLPGVYAVWMLVIVLLCPLCRWMAAGRRVERTGG